jgi:hypothetical protein
MNQAVDQALGPMIAGIGVGIDLRHFRKSTCS